MTRWEVWYRPTSRMALICKSRGPWWLYALHGIASLCLPDWRVPLVGRIRVNRGTEDEMPLSEWCGDTLDDFWECYVAHHLMNWTYQRFKKVEVEIPVDVFLLKFGDEAPQWLRDEVANEVQEQEQGR